MIIIIKIVVSIIIIVIYVKIMMIWMYILFINNNLFIDRRWTIFTIT